VSAIRASACGRARAALDAWDERAEVDLDDDSAAHIGACADCRAVFDARFVPVVARPVPLSSAPSLQRAAAPPARAGRAGWSARSRWVSAALVAAVLLAATLAMGARMRSARAATELLPPQCVQEVAVVALECPVG
jgi:hypothetical protein